MQRLGLFLGLARTARKDALICLTPSQVVQLQLITYQKGHDKGGCVSSEQPDDCTGGQYKYAGWSSDRIQ